MRVLVATFASEQYAGAAALLRHTALRNGGADGVYVFGPGDLPASSIDHTARGYGWWGWKPLVILKVLQHVNDGDMVVYCDAAIGIESPLQQVVKNARDVQLFGLSGEYPNRAWTRKRVFELMDCNATEYWDAQQVNAAIQVYRKTEAAMRFVREYAEWCSRLEVIADGPPNEINFPEFRDHRHDQSVLSLLSVKHGLDVADDPTQYGQLASPLFDHHRRPYSKLTKLAVVTATRGGVHLRRCIASVQAQALPNTDHWVVADGPDCASKVQRIIEEFANRNPIKLLVLPQQTGADGWNGHRIYGGVPHLIPDATYISYLDDDNFVDEDHYVELVRSARSVPGAEWAYSLRRIVDSNGNDVCPDACESLGGICHTVCGVDDYLVDTSCFLLSRNLAIQGAYLWNSKFRSGVETDRCLTKWLLSSFPAYGVSRRHSLAYTVSNTTRSVNREFFEKGNLLSRFDVHKTDLYVFHFSKEATSKMLQAVRATDRSYALDEWQMTLCSALVDSHNLLNGYDNLHYIPRGANVLVNLCHPSTVPLDWLASRDDLRRVVYTLESPNIRHSKQWDADFLARHFDVVLTYWTPLLKHPKLRDRAMFCPHNTHHLCFANQRDLEQLSRTNRAGNSKTACMVLERRKLAGTYEINGVKLHCLDSLREEYVRKVAAHGVRVTVFGQGWDDFVCENVTIASTKHRSQDSRSSVDIMQDYSYCIIVENCDAEGYCSEKLYDALLAGAIPLYHGNASVNIVPPELYADLRSCKLEDVFAEDVEGWKHRVLTQRKSVLKAVSAESFASCVVRALQNCSR